MRESTIQALRNFQDVFQQAAINYNVDPATHVIQAAPPRVPPDARPEPASPATPPRVGTIKPSPRPSPLLSTGTVSDPRVHDSPTTPVVPTLLDFLEDSLSLQRVLPRQSPWPNPPKVRAPSLPLKQPHQSQQITTIWHPVDNDAPARNTQSRTLVQSITQEALLACIHVHMTSPAANSWRIRLLVSNSLAKFSTPSSTPTLAPSWTCATILSTPSTKNPGASPTRSNLVALHQSSQALARAPTQLSSLDETTS
jgi:hypothetical protein